MRRDGRAVYADLGLRTVEASLIRDGFQKEEVAVVIPGLQSMIGDETRIVAIGCTIPGDQPPTSTFVDIAGQVRHTTASSSWAREKSSSRPDDHRRGQRRLASLGPCGHGETAYRPHPQGMGGVSIPRVCRQILDGEGFPSSREKRFRRGYTEHPAADHRLVESRGDAGGCTSAHRRSEGGA